MLVSCIGNSCYDDVHSWDKFFFLIGILLLLCYWLLLMLENFIILLSMCYIYTCIWLYIRNIVTGDRDVY